MSAHTPWPWVAAQLANDGRWTVNGADLKVAFRQVVVMPEANARLIAAAPTAPHDCDIPGCPGAETKRKLDAAQDLLEAAKAVVRADSLRFESVNPLPPGMGDALRALAAVLLKAEGK